MHDDSWQMLAKRCEYHSFNFMSFFIRKTNQTWNKNFRFFSCCMIFKWLLFRLAVLPLNSEQGRKIQSTQILINISFSWHTLEERIFFRISREMFRAILGLLLIRIKSDNWEIRTIKAFLSNQRYLSFGMCTVRQSKNVAISSRAMMKCRYRRQRTHKLSFMQSHDRLPLPVRVRVRMWVCWFRLVCD